MPATCWCGGSPPPPSLGDALRPAGGLRDDPVTAITTGRGGPETSSAIVYIGLRSGRIDALTVP